MLLWLANLFMGQFSPLRVVHYISFRAIVASLTSLIIVVVLCPMFIRYLRKLQIGQAVRTDGPQSHLKKSGTPTMGGVLILCAIFISVILWANLQDIQTWVFLFALLSFGLIGWFDDYRKVLKRNSKGLSSRVKFLLQSVCAAVVVAVMYWHANTPVETALLIPFMKHSAVQLGAWYLVIGYFMMVGSSNAVNLTDGLDGLALMPTILVAGALAVFAYCSGNFKVANYLMIPYLPSVSECVILASSIIGAGLGFLWFNTYPAQVFMGDVGSLTLGALLGFLAIAVRQEIVFLIMGGIFVAETFSVIVQVGSFKLRNGKRVFRMAPLHHHYELKGWAEPKIIVRFWLVTFVLVLIGLATLKLR